MTEAAAPPSYSTAEVARRLGVSVPTVQRWVDAGHLKAWKTVGGHRRIDAQSAERLFDAQGVASVRPASPSVMVVDDNPDDRDILALLIETTLPGARITVAESGFQALVAIGQTAPDILITDIVMPHMDGFEMLRQLASQCPVRPGAIIAVSSLEPDQLARLGPMPEGVRFVAKPIERHAFSAALLAAVLGLAPT